jgi:serine/threonine protein phosphatase 1
VAARHIDIAALKSRREPVQAFSYSNAQALSAEGFAALAAEKKSNYRGEGVLGKKAIRILAIGDIHGCSQALDHLLKAVAPTADDLIITLGDYVDRGPDSFGVIERLLRFRRDHRLIALKGNHEQMMLDARQGSGPLGDWLSSGGRQTLASYSVLGDEGNFVDVPDEHWSFLENGLVPWHEIDTHFFVHGSVYPDMPLSEQPDFMLFWEFFENPAPHESGKIMICGHTSQKSGVPRNLGHAICIDTWAYGNGWLTCLEVLSGRVWQTRQTGEQRSAWIDDFLVAR